MKPLARCTTPLPPSNPSSSADGDHPSERSGGDNDAITASPSSPSTSSSSATAASGSARRVIRSRTRTRLRPRVLWAARGTAHDDLALPLGMSFAAVLSQVMEKNKQGERISLNQFSRMCTAAVKESVTNIYGDKYDHFMRNFENSFRSTLQTLYLLSQTSGHGREESISNTHSDNNNNNVNISSHFRENSDVISHPPVGPTTSTQMVLHSNLNNQLSNISRNGSQQGHGIINQQHIMTTLERSVSEQVRSNNLKEFEMGLIMKKLELKKSQLELCSYSHMLDRVKVRMGMAKAMFREEKLKNQMQDSRFSELVKTFIDLLVTGLIIMLVCFGYGTYVFSYQRIKEVTEACSAVSKGSNAWYVPKQVSTFNSGWLFLRCHIIALTRLGFGVIIFLALSWLIIQKSSVARPTMPITFNIMILGIFCGITGKLCVDALGGSGHFWLILWEMLCLAHFLVSAFPASMYSLLYGPVSVREGIEVGVKRPYWIGRYLVYLCLLLVLPLSAGLLPFAPVFEWMDHFREKIRLVNVVGEEAEL